MNRRFYWSLLAGTAGISGTASAQVAVAPAQSQSAPITDDGNVNSTAPEEIIVTARKKAERLIDVPQSVTALSADDLARLNATQFRDFANTIPGLQFTTTSVGQNQVSIRGVTTGLSGSQTVGIYVDDVPYGASGSYAQAGTLALDQALYGLDHVEVLRGPQGTLYGASSLGGVVKYVTALPNTRDVGGEIQLGVSSTRSGGVSSNAAASVNVPILEDRAALRLNGYFSRDGGYIDNIGIDKRNVNRSKTYGGRADLLLKPMDRLQIRIVGAAQDIGTQGAATVDYDFDGRPRFGDLRQNRLVAEPFDQKFRLASGVVTYDFDAFNLTSVSSYQSVRSVIRQDYSGLYVPLLGSFGIPVGSVGLTAQTSTDKFVQELRAQSTNSGQVQWLMGAFYTDEDNLQHQTIGATNPDGTPFPLVLGDVRLPNTYKELAGFGNLTFQLSPSLQVTGGLRYARSKQTYEQIGSGLLIGSIPKASSDESVTTYLVNAQYKFSPNANAYVRFATGYRPGGPNAILFDPVTGDPLAPPTFGSDRLQSYELGYKAQTRDRTFAVDLAGYYIDWRDIQVVTARNGLGVVANASAGAHIYGADLTATLRPTAELTFAGSFGYNHAALAGDDPDLGGRDGERLPNVPRVTSSLTADYVMRDVRFAPRVGATIRYVSKRNASFNASQGFPQYELDGYASFDLRAGATLGPIDAQVFARNLFDRRGQLSADTRLSLFGGPAQVAVLQPRTLGLSLSSRF